MTDRWAIDFTNPEAPARKVTFGLIGEARARAWAAKQAEQGCTILAIRPQPRAEVLALMASMSPGLAAAVGKAQ